MTTRERQGWKIVASLFVTLFLIFGSGYNTGTLFFPQLVKQFGWSHARTAWLTSALALSAGFCAPLAGWLLDRIEARTVMAAGAALTGGAFLMASVSHSFAPMLIAYLILGVGIAAATLLPCAMVIANWFGARRGVAMGITFAGTSLGGAVMIAAGNIVIIHFGGWRSGYIALAAPMIVIVIPLIFMMVRTRPPEAREMSVQESADALPGFELAAAIRTRSFWMISSAQLLYACVAAASGLHLVSYLIGLGYSESFGAGMASLALLLAACGKLIMGAISDRVSARVALAVNFVVQAIGMILALGVTSGAMVPVFMLVYGLSLGAPLVLVPLLTAEAMGLKRFGSIAGVAGVFNTLGAAIGPVMAGAIFDASGSYALAFEIFAVMCVIGAAATLACRNLDAEQARMAPAVATA
ncbi:MAG TPA: MFS transporter [Candidatus Binataceae bacterium]|nr:MFS transporter [Candidatus Binataceae bacterium]